MLASPVFLSKVWTRFRERRSEATRFAELFDHYAQIMYTMVDKPWRNQGVATTLRKEAIKTLRREGFGAIVTSVKAENLASIRSNEKVGFLRVNDQPDDRGFIHLYFVI